jgi:hypothetical protein
VLYSASVLRIFGFIIWESDACGIDFVILRVGSDEADFASFGKSPENP